MILVTAFEPFDGLESNPSEDVARTLEERDVDCCILPVNYATFEARLKKALNPAWDAVLMLGLSADRDGISLERIARNVSDRTRKDNAGHASLRPTLVANGPAAYFSTLPLQRLRTRLEEDGLPVRLSNNAGSYFCNAAFYLARHTLGARSIPCGFVHLPPTPEICNRGVGLSLSQQVRGVRSMLDVLRST